MIITLKVSKAEAYGLKLLRRHMPMWFREDSDHMGTHEQNARNVLDRVLKKVGDE